MSSERVIVISLEDVYMRHQMAHNWLQSVGVNSWTLWKYLLADALISNMLNPAYLCRQFWALAGLKTEAPDVVMEHMTEFAAASVAILRRLISEYGLSLEPTRTRSSVEIQPSPHAVIIARVISNRVVWSNAPDRPKVLESA